MRINSISPPQSFRSGSANSVILDCDFTLSEDDSLVVVKWFLNDEKQHIYQWIQSKDLRIYSPKIKPYVDETFVVSDHPTRHRALRLLNPPASLSGKYTCSVSSLANEDTNSTTLVIFGKAPTTTAVDDACAYTTIHSPRLPRPLSSPISFTPEPPKSFDIAAVEVDEDRPEEEGFNITCTVIGVFPEPEIKLYKVRSNKENLVSDELQSNTTTILSFLSVTDGLYSLTLVTHIEPTNSSHINSSELLELETPSRERLALGKYNQTKTKKKKNFAEHYECKLTIPNSDFTEVRRLAIQDGMCTLFHFFMLPIAPKSSVYLATQRKNEN